MSEKPMIFRDTDFEFDPIPNVIKVVAITSFKDIPKCCEDCSLYDHCTGYCAALDEVIWYEDEDYEDDNLWVEKQRYCDCPLRELEFKRSDKE